MLSAKGIALGISADENSTPRLPHFSQSQIDLGPMQSDKTAQHI